MLFRRRDRKAGIPSRPTCWGQCPRGKGRIRDSPFGTRDSGGGGREPAQAGRPTGEGRGNCQNGRRRPTAGIRDPGLGGRWGAGGGPGGEGRGVNRLGAGADTTALILRFSAGRHAPGTRQGSPRHRHPGRDAGNTGLEPQRTQRRPLCSLLSDQSVLCVLCDLCG